jgi:hypothetical protein
MDFYAMIHINDDFETRRPKILKKKTKFKKCTTTNTGCDVQKQHR